MPGSLVPSSIWIVNLERPFNDALRMALRQRPQALRRIADRLLDEGEEGDLQSIREIADRLDGKGPANHRVRRRAHRAVDRRPTSRHRGALVVARHRHAEGASTSM